MPAASAVSPPAASSPPKAASPPAPARGSAPSPGAPAPGAGAPPLKTASEEYMGDAFADLDALNASEGKTGAPEKGAGDKRPPSKAKSASGAEDDEQGAGTGEREPGESAEVAGASGKPGSEASASGESPKPVKAKELREAYEALKARQKTEFEPEIIRLRSRVQELEAGSGTVPKEAQDRLAAAEQRAAALEQHIRFVDYSKSKEYQEKYWQPYVTAWNAAVRELKGLTMQVENAETGEKTPREVTEADLQYFAALDPAVRRTEINRLFPEDKEEVKRHINEISRTFEASQVALKKAREDSETHAKTAVETQRQIQANRVKLWKETNDAMAAKYPQWFAPAEGDTEGNAVLDKGLALSSLVFSPADLTPDAIESLPKVFKEAISARKFTPELMTRAQAIVARKAANHDRLAHQNHTLQARVKELEESLKQYEESGPDGAPAKGRPRAGTKDFMGDAAAELEALDRAHSA